MRFLDRSETSASSNGLHRIFILPSTLPVARYGNWSLFDSLLVYPTLAPSLYDFLRTSFRLATGKVFA